MKLTPDTPVFATEKLQEALRTHGKSEEGKPCADHGKPIIAGWLDLPIGFCFCGEKLDWSDRADVPHE